MNLLLVLIVFYILRSDKSASQAEIVLNHPLFPFRVNSVGNGCFLKEVGFIPTGKVAIIYGHIQARCLDDGTIGYTDCCSNRNLAYCCPNGQKHIHYHFESTPTNFYNVHPFSDIMHQDIPLSEVTYPAPFPFSADASGNFLHTSVIPSQDFAFPFTIPSTFHYLPGTPTEAVPPGLDFPYNAIQIIPPKPNDPSLQIIGPEIMSPQLINNLTPTEESTVYDSLDHPYPAYFHDHFLQPEISLNDYFPDFNVLHNDFHDYDHLGTASYQSVPSYIYHNNLFHNDFIYHDPTYFYNQLSQPEFISTADVPDIDVLHNHLLDYDHLGTPSSETISHHIYHNSLSPHDFIHQDQLLHDHDHIYHNSLFPHDFIHQDQLLHDHDHIYDNSLFPHDFIHQDQLLHDHDFADIPHHTIHSYHFNNFHFYHPEDIPLADTFHFNHYRHDLYHNEHMDSPIYHSHSHQFVHGNILHHDLIDRGQGPSIYNKPKYEFSYHSITHEEDPYYHKAIHSHRYSHHINNDYYDHPDYSNLYQGYRVSTNDPHVDYHYYDHHHHHHHYYHHYDHYDHHHHNHYYDEPEPYYDHYHHHRHHYYDEPEHYHDDYHHHRHHYYDEPEYYHDDHYYHDYPPDDYYYPPYDHDYPYDDYYPEDDYPAYHDEDHHFHDISHDPVFYDDNAFPYDDYHDPTCCGSLDYNYPYFDHPIHDYSFGDTGYHVLPLHDDYPSGYVYQHPYHGYPYHGEWYYDFPYDDYAGTQYPFRDYPFYGFPFYGFPYSHFPYEHPFHYPFHFPFHGFGYPGLVRSTHHSLVFDKVSPNDVNVEMKTKVQKAGS